MFLDVRPELAAGREPFDMIMRAAENLIEGETLEIAAPFDPVLLYRVLEMRGFEHRTERLPDGGWSVTFSRAVNDG